MSAPLSPYGTPDQDLLFWLKEYLSRKTATLSNRSSSKEEAQSIAELRQQIKMQDKTLDEIDEITKKIAQNGFKSIRVYSYPIIDFIRFCLSERNIETITDISATLIQEDYFAARHYGSLDTKKNHYRLIVSFINYIEKNNFIDEIGSGFLFGMEKMPRSFDAKKIPETLLPDEFEKFIDYLNSHYTTKQKSNVLRNRLMCKILCYTGFRESELIGITKKSINSVDKDGYYPIKVVGKGNKERIVYLNRKLVDNDLIPWLDQFEDSNTKIFNISTGMLYQIVCDALKIAGIQKSKMGPHLLRHSYATYLLYHKVGLSQVQKLLGHESITTTTIYAKVMDRDIKDAARVF